MQLGDYSQEVVRNRCVRSQAEGRETSVSEQLCVVSVGDREEGNTPELNLRESGIRQDECAQGRDLVTVEARAGG